MMKQIFTLLLLVGLLAVPVVVGAVAECGDGTYDGCTECATEELCAAEVPCWWESCEQGTQELCEAAGCTWDITCTLPYCNSQGVAVVESADITEIGSKTGSLSTDLMPLVVLIIGVPLGFMIIKRAIGIMPKK